MEVKVRFLHKFQLYVRMFFYLFLLSTYLYTVDGRHFLCKLYQIVVVSLFYHLFLRTPRAA